MDSSINWYVVRRTILCIADAIGIALAFYIALLARFDFSPGNVPQVYIEATSRFVPIAVVISMIVYYFLRLYHSIWRYASINEVYRIFTAYIILGLTFIVLEFIPAIRIPRGVLFIGYFISFFFCTAVRFGYRIARTLYIRYSRKYDKAPEKVLLIGAGFAAREVLKDLKGKKEFRVRTIVDDNPTTHGRYLEGVRIEGDRNDIKELVDKYEIDLIVFAIPSASVQDRKEILDICRETGKRIQSVPGLVQIITGEVNTTRLRDVSTDELLERDEIRVNTSEIMEAIQGKVIMVTGGGGSIGSELCRQIAAAGPKQLIIFDIYENNAYDLQMELQRKYPDLNLVTLIGSVRNTNRVNSVLKQYHPDVIYHAAAHKHVPLMETSPDEAVKNNVMGTYKLATAAARAGVKRFLLISTDKAVNPTSLMGATKRICEMIIQMMARDYPDTVFMAVRFGNVLGSNGSVVPLFKKQIEAGGPVTVTDPNIIRYFMTIPEAVSLVLQASYFAKGGEIFVLDMGKPVRIDDMARNLIRLSGYKPDEDIKIVYTGLRPGEKLYEELLMDEEGMTKTENDLIYIGHPIKMDEDLFRQQLQRLDEASRNETAADDMKRIVAEVVTTYHPDLADSIKTGA